MGNTCYMNAVLVVLLQVFIARPDLFQEDRTHRDDQDPTEEAARVSFACVVFSTLHELNGRNTPCTPSVFIDAVKKAMPKYNNDAEHDAAELFNDLLDFLPNVRQEFWCLRQDVVLGNCGHSSVTDAETWTLVVGIRADEAVVQLDDMIAAERTEEHASWFCDVCRLARPATTTSTIRRLPKFAWIQISRTDDVGIRRDTIVTYGATVTFAPLTESAPSTYSLRAVVERTGTSWNHGHFKSIVRDQAAGNWLQLNDSSPISPSAAAWFSSDAYIIVAEVRGAGFFFNSCLLINLKKHNSWLRARDTLCPTPLTPKPLEMGRRRRSVMLRQSGAARQHRPLASRSRRGRGKEHRNRHGGSSHRRRAA
jgi:ubiquitin C-terminal hydrolase